MLFKTSPKFPNWVVPKPRTRITPVFCGLSQSAPIPNWSDGDLSPIRGNNKTTNTASTSFYISSRNAVCGSRPSDRIVIKCSIVLTASGIVPPEKYVIICNDSQAALKALKTGRTTSPLIQQCQKALNDIFTRHAVGLHWVPGHAGVQGNEIADELARDGSALNFVGPEPALGASGQDIRRGIRR